MAFKHSILYTALFTGVSVSVLAETQTDVGSSSEMVLDQVNVVTELEKAKAAGEKQKEIVNLSLLGLQTAFTSPIAVVHYDEKAFENSQQRNLLDGIAKIDSSVMNFGGETNTLSGIYVRGLQLDARQITVNGLAGLYSTYNSPTAAVSSAQLIKGASTAVAGMDPEGAAGSSLNVETKRATDEDINQLGFAWYSNNRLQETFDFGRRFGANKEWGIRLNGKYRDGDTARHNYDERNKEFAVGLDYRGEKFRAGIDYMYAKRATHGGRARIQDIHRLNYRLPGAPSGDTNFVPYWNGQTTQDQTIMGIFEYDLPYNMMLSGGLGYMESRYYGTFGQVRMMDETTYTEQYRLQQLRAMDYHIRTTSGNLKLQGEFETGSINHNWNLAFDAVRRQRDFDQGTVLNQNIYSNLNLYHPQFMTSQQPNKAVTQGATNEKLASYSLAFADTASFIDNTVRLTLGGRFQWIKQHALPYPAKPDRDVRYHESRFSPMVMAAYVPNPNLTFYANYLEDLEPGATDEDTGVMAKPVVSRQIELGVRKNWKDLATTTLSIYQLSRPGVHAKTGQEQGKERNRGIELNIYGNLLNSTLRPSLGITYNQGKLIDYPSFAGPIINGSQVASPRWIAKAAVEWDTPFIRALTLNAAVQYYGKSYQDYSEKFAFPSYTTVDAGAKYVAKLSEQQSLTFRVGVENLFNKSYWQVQRGRYDRSFAVLGMPRTYWANVEYSF
ncbi:TonB-dependent receptor [Rodentibacter genomosp. 2]|uniref:Ligand-gated channel protein n=1 Tax=Rodentibacter genomosp. 2 TaxID=1908266 RepID=A0A1V3JC33_9PAST|nr:TonB-dependent receptor [Rodentibacter genomosp. 2]OOF54253.1 ligand-gated channel protein [Rodentibacter genomosp. 2]